jgi:hypothetical protein
MKAWAALHGKYSQHIQILLKVVLENDWLQGLPTGEYSMRPCLFLWYFHPRKMWGYVGIWCSPNTLKSPQIPFPKNTLA